MKHQKVRPPVEAQTFRAVLREAREKAGLTLRELGVVVGVAGHTLSRIETGYFYESCCFQAWPSPELSQLLAASLDLDEDALQLAAGHVPASWIEGLTYERAIQIARAVRALEEH